MKLNKLKTILCKLGLHKWKETDFYKGFFLEITSYRCEKCNKTKQTF